MVSKTKKSKYLMRDVKKLKDRRRESQNIEGLGEKEEEMIEIYQEIVSLKNPKNQ